MLHVSVVSSVLSPSSPLLFIHSPVDGHLGCVQFGTIMNSAAMDISVQVFLQTYVFISLGKYLGVNC